AEVAQRVLVRRQIEIVARLVAQHRFGGRHLRLGRRGHHQNYQHFLHGESLHGASLHGTTANLYCSNKSSSFAVLKSLVRKSTGNFFICAEKLASPRDVAASST